MPETKERQKIRFILRMRTWEKVLEIQENRAVLNTLFKKNVTVPTQFPRD